MTLYFLSVDVGSVLAALVDHPVGAVIRDNLGVVARYARIGDYQVLVDLAADTERTMDERKSTLLAPLHQDERGKNPWSRLSPRIRYRSNSHAGGNTY